MGLTKGEKAGTLPHQKKKGGFIMKKRKDKNGRVLPDGVSLRADGRYIYRYRLYKNKSTCIQMIYKI